MIGFGRERRQWLGCRLSALGADATRYEVPAGVSGRGLFMMCGAGWGFFAWGRGAISAEVGALLVIFASFGEVAAF